MAEINEIGSNFTLNVLLYDETEDFYDTELKYPYNDRRNVLGSYAVNFTEETFNT